MAIYEIGCVFPGIPSAAEEVALLDAVLDKYGRAWADWVKFPEMYHKEPGVCPTTFWEPDSMLTVYAPVWGFRGELRNEPEDTTNVWVDGVRANSFDFFSADFV